MFIFAANFFKGKVDLLKHYVIPFTGLGLGGHEYYYKITYEFFEHFENSEIKNADIDVKVVMEKQSTMLILDFDITGKVEFICDRCQESYLQEIKGTEHLIFKFNEDLSQSNEEIIILPVSENKIDLSQHIFDYINLMLPYRRIHPDDENGNSLCNREMIERLKSFEKKEQPDPRWDALKNLNL